MHFISFFQKKKIPRQKQAIHQYHRQKKKWQLFFLLFAFLGFFSGLVYFLAFSSFLKINNIIFEIQDYPSLRFDQLIIRNEILKIAQKKLLFFIPRDSLFIFPSHELKKIFSQDRQVANFLVTKKIPHTLKIGVQIFEPKAVFISFDKKSYLLNEKGSVIKELPDFSAIINAEKLPIFYEKSQQGVEYPERVFIAALKFIEQINRQDDDFKITEIEILDRMALKTKAKTSEGWFLYFDASGDLNRQINNLNLLLRKKISERKNLEYIDLSFNNRIYYKYK